MLAGRNLRCVSQRSVGPSRVAQPQLASARRSLVCVAHGHGHGHGAASGVVTEKDRGFIAEMRKVAMKLHTKDQAPKEGGTEAPKPQVWTPTREGYLQFLAESKTVYDALEQAVYSDKHPEYASLRNTGLERSQALAKDLELFATEYGLTPPELQEDGPGRSYARLLLQLADTDPAAFICHFYNFYFAHTAGGRMIGNKVSSMVLDSRTLAFYQWEGDVNEHLEGVRRSINRLAEAWGADQKAHCLQETEASFRQSGVIMRCITAPAPAPAQTPVTAAA